MPISRGMYPSGVGVGRSDAPRALQGQLCTAGPILPMCSWQEARFRTWAEASLGQRAGPGFPGTPALAPAPLPCLHTPASLSHQDPCLRSPPPLVPPKGGPAPLAGVCPTRPPARQRPQPSCCGRASSSCPAGSSATLGGLLPAGSGCGPLRAHFPSQAQGRSPGEEGELRAGLHRDTVCTRCGAQTLLGEFCLLSPGARPSVHLSICQLQSLGVLPWVLPCSLVKTNSRPAFLSKGSHSRFRGELCPCALQRVRPLYEE